MLLKGLGISLELLSNIKSKYSFRDRDDYRITSHVEKKGSDKGKFIYVCVRDHVFFCIH